MHALIFHLLMFAKGQEAIGLFSEEEGGEYQRSHEEISYLIEAVFCLSLIKNFFNLQKCLVSFLNYLGKVPLDLVITCFLCSPHFGLKEISKIILILYFPISGLQKQYNF